MFHSSFFNACLSLWIENEDIDDVYILEAYTSTTILQQGLQATLVEEDVTLHSNSLSSPMVHPDRVIWTNPGKKKKKKRNNSKSLANVVPVENVTLQRNSTASEMVLSDIEMSAEQGKKKKKIKKMKRKNLNALANVNFIQQPVNTTCLVTDSRLQQCSVQGEVSDNIRKTSFGDFSLSNDSNIRGSNSGLMVDSRSTLEVKVKQIPEADLNPVSKIVKGNDQVCANNGSKELSLDAPLDKKKRKKKKKNLNVLVSSVIMPSTSVMGDPELMQHSTEHGVSQRIHQNECATKDKNCSGEDSSGIVDAKVDEISVCQDKAVGNIHGEEKKKRKIRGNNLNLEPEEGVISSNDLLEEQQVKRAKLNADQNVGIGRMLPGSVQKKLLVLDLNGLLADVVGDKTVTIKADGHVAGKKSENCSC